MKSLFSGEKKNGEPVNVLTHCNAGWLATVDWGTALAPVFKAQAAGIPLMVWVDETRPLNQGSRLTAWELGKHGVPHTVITDNAGGHLMQQGMVDVYVAYHVVLQLRRSKLFLHRRQTHRRRWRRCVSLPVRAHDGIHPHVQASDSAVSSHA